MKSRFASTPSSVRLFAGLLLVFSATGCYELRDRNERLSAEQDTGTIPSDTGISTGEDSASDAGAPDADAALDSAVADSADVARIDATDSGTDSDASRDAGRPDSAGDAADASIAADAADATADVVPADAGCPAGTEPLGATCVATGATPRPITPLSLGETTRRRPMFRWELPSGMDGAVLEVCRDRACTMILETRRAVGTSTQANVDLPATTALFWRLRGTSGAATSSRTSPVWMFRTPLLGANNPINTSATPHLDVNADGFDDLAIGAPSASPSGRIGAGTVTIYFGSATGPSATASQTLEGVSAGDRLGNSVAAAGDIDGDGYGDLVVGASLATVSGATPLSNAGKVYVYRGGPTGLNTTPAYVFNGSATGDNFGHSVSSAGDVNGDGYADILASAWLANTATGQVNVYHGRAAGLAMTPAIALTGPDFYSQFGISVAHAGDANGDGFSDIVVGAALAPRTAPSTGRAYVYYGGASGIVASASRLLAGAAANDRFGCSVAGGFDVNNDGFSDLVIGAFRADIAGQTDAGAASLFLGRAAGYDVTPHATMTLPMASAEDFFGASVTNLGDVNRDGYDDLAIGALQADRSGRTNSGLVAIFHGNLSGVSAMPVRLIDGESAGDGFGAALAVLDANGDGFEDLVASGPQALAMPAGAGRVSFFAGGASSIPTTAARTWAGTSAGDAFGASVGR
ncbi:MAG: FG-GAP repeat protein [Myxococcales bacterium]|nr:FG-GAP repeat protein [Myxococcales bacterium]